MPMRLRRPTGRTADVTTATAADSRSPRDGVRDAQARYHGLDGLRALAMLLGIVLHATLPYFARIAGIESMWPADDDQSLALLVLFDFIHLWRMPVFFLLAGFFAHLVLERRCTSGVHTRPTAAHRRTAGPVHRRDGAHSATCCGTTGGRESLRDRPRRARSAQVAALCHPGHAAGAPLVPVASAAHVCGAARCCAVSVRRGLAWLSAPCHRLRRWGGARSAAAYARAPLAADGGGGDPACVARRRRVETDLSSQCPRPAVRSGLLLLRLRVVGPPRADRLSAAPRDRGRPVGGGLRRSTPCTWSCSVALQEADGADSSGVAATAGTGGGARATVARWCC